MGNTVLGLHVSLARHCLCCCRRMLMCISVRSLCFFFIFLSLILEQVRAHDREEIQSIWFWARFNRFRCASHWTKSRIIARKQKRICEAKWAITTQITTKSTQKHSSPPKCSTLIWYFTHTHTRIVCVCVTHNLNWEWCVRVNWAGTSNIQVFSRKQCKLLKIVEHWCHCLGSGLSPKFYIKMLLEPNYSKPPPSDCTHTGKCTAMVIDHIEVIRRTGDNANGSKQ